MVSEGVCDNDRTAKPRAANLSQSYPTLPAWRLVSASIWPAGGRCSIGLISQYVTEHLVFKDFTRSQNLTANWYRRTKNMRLRRIPPRGTSSPETPGAVHARRGAIS